MLYQESPNKPTCKLSVISCLLTTNTWFCSTPEKEIAIQVNTSELESSGSWVNVSWSGVPSPDAEDWIGVYSPPVNNSIDPASHAPVKYQVKGAPSTHIQHQSVFKNAISYS